MMQPSLSNFCEYGPHHRVGKGLFLLLFCTILSACSLFDGKDEVITTGLDKNIYWPEKPEKPRIAFRQVVRAAEDLGIKKSFFSKVVDFVFGDDDIVLVKPMAVVKLDDGSLYIADPGVRGVHFLNSRENEYELIQQEDDKPLTTPVALATDGKRVFVADSTQGIFLIEKDADIAVPLTLDTPPKQGTGIAYESGTKRLYIVDTAEHRINVYDKNGHLSQQIGERGPDDGQFNYPTMVWLDSSGQLYVTDSLNFRIQIFDREGRFVRKFGQMGTGSGRHSRPKGVATDRFGHIYVVDSLFHSVQVFNQQGDFLLNFGVQGGDFGEFWLPTGIFIDADNGSTIYVADSYNKRLQIFQYVGGAG